MTAGAVSLLPALQAGEVQYGAWFLLPGATSVELVGGFGFDFAVIDLQHGCFGYETGLEMIRAANLSGMVPVARVAWNEPAGIGRALDAGALGVIVPMIETAEDARRAVAASLYAPEGTRSFGPVRVSARDGATYRTTIRERLLILPMIETRGALDCVDEILAVPGVSGVLVGPSDLSLALGLTPGDNDGDLVFDAAIDRILTACKRADKVAAVFSGPAAAATRVRQGFRMVSVVTDVGALASACGAALQSTKSGATPPTTDAPGASAYGKQ